MPKTKHSTSYGSAPLTIAPVAVECGAGAEFVDLAGLEKLFSIRRGHAYTLLADGSIRGMTLRRRGNIKGKRLIDVDSVRRFLASQPERTDRKLSKQCQRANAIALEARRTNTANNQSNGNT